MSLKKILFFILTFVSIEGACTEVKLVGNITDPRVKYARIVSFPPVYGLTPISEKLVVRSEVRNQKVYLKFNVDSSTWLQFKISGLTTEIFVVPGDSLDFSVVSVKGRSVVRFSGNKSDRYNLPFLLQEKFVMKERTFKFNEGDSFILYCNKIDRWYSSKVAFIEHFYETKEIPEKFYQYQLREAFYQKVFYILDALAKSNEANVDFNKIFVDQFEQQMLAESYCSRSFMLALVSYYTLLEKRQLGLDNIYLKINSVENKHVRDFMQLNMLSLFIKKSENLTNSNELRKNLLRIRKEIGKESTWFKFVDSFYNDFFLVGNLIPLDVLKKTQLVKLNTKSVISLFDLFVLNKNKGLYIDFWASWCAPCRNDNLLSSESRRSLQNESYVYISISVDNNLKNWERACFEDGVTSNQYVLTDGTQSPLTKYFNIREIPRYLILDNEHVVRDLNAPRPIPDQNNKLINRIREVSRRKQNSN
ncbi:thioredoxin-like domain-containing protein [Olivibacter sp. CPCC 100613]|uniref:TlpA family protein disulfide reductase n=1 Tax=Olivibacter sp. CPCC 100613 TaxID=3079931 RepID=UPI002FFCC317